MGNSGAGSTNKTTVRVVNRAGQQVRRAVKTEPLTVEVEVPGAADPSNPPDNIEIGFRDEGAWASDDMGVAWNGDHRGDTTVFRSEPLTIEAGGAGGDRVSVGGFTWKTNGYGGDSTHDGEVVSITGPDGTTTTVEVFNSTTTLLNAELRDTATAQRNGAKAGAATVQGALDKLEEVREDPNVDPEKADKLETHLKDRLQKLTRLLCLAENALAWLDNDQVGTHKQNAAANFYLNGGQDGADPGQIAQVVPQSVLEKAKWDAWENGVLAGMTQLALDSYKGIAGATGMAQLYTILSDTDEMGKKATWDKKLVAFCDLLSMAAMSGASQIKTMRDLSQRTHMGPSKVGQRAGGETIGPKRYKGDTPEKAPSGTIVDPGKLGYSPDGVGAAHRVARKHDVTIQTRPTNPAARYWREEFDAIPKAEKYKAKTVSPLDQTLGADPTAPPGRVACFDPKPDVFADQLRKSGMPDAQVRDTVRKIDEVAIRNESLPPGAPKEPLPVPEMPPGSGWDAKQWNDTVERYAQRKAEWEGPTGQKMRKLEAEGKIKIDEGGIVTEDGKFITGDYDTWDVLDRDGNPVPKAKYDQVIADLTGNEFKAQHGAHKRWDPQRSDYPPGPEGDATFKTMRGIYEKIIGDHASKIDPKTGRQAGEILLNLTPEGPPLATYSGQKVGGPYYGDMPKDWGNLTPNGWNLPANWAWWGAGLMTTDPMNYSKDIEDFSATLSSLYAELEPCRNCIEEPLVALRTAAAFPWLKVGAGVGALALLVGGGLALAGSGDGDAEEELISTPDPIVEQIDDDEPLGATPDEVIIVIPEAMRFRLINQCTSIFHSPDPRYDSPSWFRTHGVVGAVDGTMPEMAELTANMGGDMPSMGPMGDAGRPGAFVMDTPISSFATYESADGTFGASNGGTVDGTLFVDVGPDEGPVDGCVPWTEWSDDEFDALLAENGFPPDGGPHEDFVPTEPDDDVGTPTDVDPGSGDTGGGPGGPPAAITDTPEGGSAPSDDLAFVREFLGIFDRAHQAGDVATLYDRLDPLAIDRYGEQQCRDYLDFVVGSVSDLRLVDGRLQPYKYPTDGRTVPPFEAWNVDVEWTVFGSDKETTNFNLGTGGPNGAITWFTDCGEPI